MSLVINFASAHRLSLSSADALSGPHQFLDKANKPGIFFTHSFRWKQYERPTYFFFLLLSLAILSIELLSLTYIIVGGELRFMVPANSLMSIHANFQD